MTTNPTTYELRILFPEGTRTEHKENLLAWLPAHGVESFVEGVVDGEDLGYDVAFPSAEGYSDGGGDMSPVSIYHYSAQYLKTLAEELTQEFSHAVRLEHHEMATATWLDGWKDSFKPIYSRRFVIYPPWETLTIGEGRQGLCIEPAMAFGTGQHETTQLCLEELEELAPEPDMWHGKRLLDFGTGTGILAMAAAKLGFTEVDAIDCDEAAVRAAQVNGVENGVQYEVWQATLTEGHDPRLRAPYDVIVANILLVVLEPMIGRISELTVAGGHVILSGLLVEQRETMVRAAHAVGLDAGGGHDFGGWCSIHLRKR